MPKLIRPRRKANRSRHPRRLRANPRRHTPKYALVRGPARNPVQMALYSTKAQAEKMARWERSHFPHSRIRVVRYRPEKGKA